MILKAARTWVGTVAGKWAAGALILFTIVVVWKWQSIYDHARVVWWGLNNAQAVMHEAKKDTAMVEARADSVAGSAATKNLDQLLVSPEIRSNAGAQKVGTAAHTAIAKKDSEIKNLRTAVTEETAAAKNYKDAGEKPVKRVQPYVDFGFAHSFTKKPGYTVPVFRLGATYRVVSWAHVQGEVSYEPPPKISQARMDALDKIGEGNYARPEVRITVTGHIAF